MASFVRRLLESVDRFLYRFPRGRPRVGTDVYLPSRLYLGHGRDDFRGGLCRVSEVKVENWGGSPCYVIEVEEDPGAQHNWSTYLGPLQRKLRAQYGVERGHPDPDHRPEFNED